VGYANSYINNPGIGLWGEFEGLCNYIPYRGVDIYYIYIVVDILLGDSPSLPEESCLATALGL